MQSGAGQGSRRTHGGVLHSTQGQLDAAQVTDLVSNVLGSVALSFFFIRLVFFRNIGLSRSCNCLHICMEREYGQDREG